MQIAILDYFVVTNNAIGNCDRNILAGLCDEHDFTVFAVEFDNPNPERIKFVRVPAFKRPLFLLFISYHLLIPIIFWLYRRRNNVKFDLVQSIESNSLLGNLVYAHFCHSTYLKQHFPSTRPAGLRGIARWLDHKLHALLEDYVYKKGKLIVVPSHGLEREIKSTYGNTLEEKITVLANPVDTNKMRRPEDIDLQRKTKRDALNITDDDLVLVFVALGHFERKGLPILFDAVAQVNNSHVKILVVGGTPPTIEEYKRLANKAGLQPDQVIFTGMQKDIRPFIWSADVFTLPSSYEVFPLVSLEAAAAGLPLLVSPLNGVEEFLENGHNGWTVPRTADGLAEKIDFALNNRNQLRDMGKNAEASVSKYELKYFVENWRQCYQKLG